MRNKKSYFIGLLSGIFIAVMLFGVYSGVQSITAIMRENGVMAETVEYADQNSKFKDILEKLNQYYYEDFDEEALYTESYKGFVDAIGDPYTVYYTEDEFKSFTEGIDGTYEGIGAYVGYGETKDELLIIAPMEGSPSEKAGLEALDRFITVDGVEVSGLTIEALVKLIKGEKGTEVIIEVERDNERIEAVVTREKIIVPTVSHEMLEDQMGYIRISGFDGVTYEQFIEAFNELEEQNQEGLIIDLRYNGGGLTHIVSQIANALLPEGIIYYTEDKDGEQNIVKSDDKTQFDKPLVILVNGSSASASEILAGAVKDRDRGVIVGTTTFGKGLVQQPAFLEDGSALKITIAKYFTPNGNYIHGIGIEPDVIAELPEIEEDEELPEDYDPQLDVAKEELMKLIEE